MCLTAKIFRKQGGVEHDYLMQRNFQCYESLFQTEVVLAVEEMPLEGFLQDSVHSILSPVKMMYCYQETVGAVRNAMQAHHTVWIDEEDTQKLRSLGDYKNLVLFITKPYLMRGFDYRSSRGIELLLSRPFEHERAFPRLWAEWVATTIMQKYLKCPTLSWSIKIAKPSILAVSSAPNSSKMLLRSR